MNKIYGIKNCGSVKKALEWFVARDLPFEFHDFRKEGIDPVLLDEWIAKTSCDVLLNRKGLLWRKFDKARREAVCDNPEGMRALMLENPVIIKRPVIVHPDGSVTVGPDSVGYEITKKALVFGGDVMTATDIAVRLGMVELGDKSKVETISQEVADKAMAAIRALVEDSVDAMKVSNADVDLILVGGGSIILPEKISGAATVLKPEHFGCANAIGSAISKVSGTYEKLMNYDELPREQSLEKAKNEAIELAVEAGAVRETVEIIEMEDVPLAYYPGNTNRVKIKAAGDLN